MVKDAQQKLQKHEGFLKELLDRSQVLQQEINSLQEQADAEKAASDTLLPPMPPPSFPPVDTVVKSIDEVPGGLGEELQEDDQEMEEVEEIDNGGGVGAFLATLFFCTPDHPEDRQTLSRTCSSHGKGTPKSDP